MRMEPCRNHARPMAQHSPSAGSDEDRARLWRPLTLLACRADPPKGPLRPGGRSSFSRSQVPCVKAVDPDAKYAPEVMYEIRQTKSKGTSLLISLRFRAASPQRVATVNDETPYNVKCEMEECFPSYAKPYVIHIGIHKKTPVWLVEKTL